MKILIVDDDRSTLILCAAILKEYSTFQVSDSRKALEVFQEIDPEVVLLDCRMPHIDGFQIAQQIKMVNSNCKIVMMSAAIFEEINFTDYCDVFLLKPLRSEMLKKTIDDLVLTPSN